MENKKEKTAFNPSVGADERQPIQKNAENSISEYEENIKSFEEMQREMQLSLDPSYLKAVSMNELFDTQYQSKPPLIDGLLYPGTYIFAGSPKLGKSFLMAQLAYHISTGTPLWNYTTRKGTVLYLALEDDYRRLQERLYRMFGTESADNLFFSVSASQLGKGLDEQLARFVAEHTDTKLIIIDMMPQLVIDDITKKIPMYTHFIKLDVKSFYGSINHDKLIKIIKRKIHKAEIISIIWNAIRTEALLCPIKEKTVKKERILGVPEGLPISNTLANIYMQDIDIKYRNLDYISYYRYVDDILILVNEDKFYDVKRSICDDINKLGLELNDKEDEGFVTQTFEYLGYVLNDSEVTVRKSSILKIEQSIEELFRTIKKENIEYLQWKLNLKITGFIIERHKYGWLFFYSQITDLSLLFHLDDVVQKLIKRYKLEGEIKVKRFVRTYAEMHMALHETKYIPNLDDLGLDDKKAILSDIYQIDLSDKDERFVEIQFHRIMKREIRDIEKDIENIS